MKIIYIAGDGRSGSTFLEIVLSHIEGSLSIGEAMRFWKRFEEGSSYCGCGSPIIQCELWSQFNLQNSTDEEMTNDRMAEHVRRINEFRNLKSISKWTTSEFKKEYNAAVIQFYKGITEVTGKNILIDGSKSMAWGHYLQSLNFCEVQVIHLERKLTGVANSWKKTIRLPEYKDEEVNMPQRSNGLILKTAFKVKLGARKLKKGGSYHFLRYEDLTASFDHTLKRLSKFLGQPLPLGGISIKPNHGIGGNPLRFQKEPQLTLRQTEESPDLLKSREIGLFTIFDRILRIF